MKDEGVSRKDATKGVSGELVALRGGNVVITLAWMWGFGMIRVCSSK